VKYGCDELRIRKIEVESIVLGNTRDGSGSPDERIG
jgi:hypothetical protein